jgi:hypothetical protein
MRLAASAMPPRSAGPFDGRVHSVFRRVINVRVDGDALLTLYAGNDEGAPPGAIAIAAPADFDFSRHITASTAIACRGGVLRIAGSDVSVDLRGARQRDLRSIEPAAHGADDRLLASWQTAWQCLIAAGGSAGLVVALNGKRPAGSLDAALAGRARLSLPRLLEAVRTYDIDGAASAAARLVGAGPGLTPSGDDYLAGFLVGARHTTQNKAQLALVDALGRELAILYGDSGDISRAYLAHAAAGRVARPLATLAKSITDGADQSAIETATTVALHIGHSSGADGTFGLLCGLAAWRGALADLVAAALAR